MHDIVDLMRPSLIAITVGLVMPVAACSKKQDPAPRADPKPALERPRNARRRDHHATDVHAGITFGQRDRASFNVIWNSCDVAQSSPNPQLT